MDSATIASKSWTCSGVASGRPASSSAWSGSSINERRLAGSRNKPVVKSRIDMMDSPPGGGLRGSHGFAGCFGGAWRQLDRVIGHLSENVELPLEFPDPGVALVLLELR